MNFEQFFGLLLEYGSTSEKFFEINLDTQGNEQIKHCECITSNGINLGLLMENVRTGKVKLTESQRKMLENIGFFSNLITPEQHERIKFELAKYCNVEQIRTLQRIINEIKKEKHFLSQEDILVFTETSFPIKRKNYKKIYDKLEKILNRN